MTWYPQNYVEKVPMTNMNMRANPSIGYPGRTYRFYEGPVVFSFGQGLSYTKFTQSLAQAPKDVLIPLSSIRGFTNSTLSSIRDFTNSTMLTNGVRVKHKKCTTLSLGVDIDVQNTGTMDGTHTLLVFSTPPSGAWSKNKQLVGFEKVHVAAGSKQRVRIGIHACKHLSVVDNFGIRRIPMGKHKLQIGDLKHSISVQSNLQEIQT